MALDLSVNFVVNLAIQLLHATIDLISIFKVLTPYPSIPLILHHVILSAIKYKLLWPPLLQQIVSIGFLTLVQHTIYPNLLILSQIFIHIRGMTKSIDNEKKLSILHVGSKSFKSSLKSFRLQIFFHVPHLATILISRSKFCTNNNSFFEFHPIFFLIKDQDMKKALLQGKLEKGLYKFHISHVGFRQT